MATKTTPHSNALFYANAMETSQKKSLSKLIRRSLRHSSHKCNHGFSLIEILISIVVLSFGLLGMVGLQSAALQANKEAKLQSAAVTLAREIAESIRGNKSEGVKAAASNPYVGDFSSPLTAGTPSYCLSIGSTTACADSAEIARAQLTEWLTRVDAELPGARAVTCFDTAPFDASGSPRWACDGNGTSLVVKVGWTKGSTDKTQTGSAALDRASKPSVVVAVTAGGV